MTDPTDSLLDLRNRLRAFALERDWDQFHTPKNLASALSVEAAELLEHFQWLTAEQSVQLDAEKQNAVAMEAADVLLYLVRLTDKLDIDLYGAAIDKIAHNAEKYPAEKSRGSALKYDQL